MAESMDPAQQLLGEWKAQFEMPIKYVFDSDTDLILHIQDYAPMPIKYTIDASQTPHHLNIKHVGGPLGNGEERCIFQFENDGKRLLIASPIPTADSTTFGPRPTDFNGVTAVAFLKPGYEVEVQQAEMAKVAHLSDEEQICCFFLESAKVYDAYAEAIVQGDDASERFEQLQQLMMMQHLQVARLMRALEMRYKRPFDKIQQIIQAQSAADFGAKVQEAFATFMQQMVRMQRIQQMFKQRAEENQNGPSIAAAASAPPAPAATAAETDAEEARILASNDNDNEPEAETDTAESVVRQGEGQGAEPEKKVVTVIELEALAAADTNKDGKLDEEELEGLMDKYEGVKKPKSGKLEATAPAETPVQIDTPAAEDSAAKASSGTDATVVDVKQGDGESSTFTYVAIAGLCVAAGLAAYVFYNRDSKKQR